MDFAKAREAFQHDEALVAAVDSWERGETTGIGTDKPPIFQRILESLANANTVPRTVLA